MQVSGTLGNRAGLAPLKQALHAYALRHRVIASNIANAEVEGYQPRRVTFEDAARKAMGNGTGLSGYATDPGHMPVGNGPADSIQPRIVTERSPAATEAGAGTTGEDTTASGVNPSSGVNAGSGVDLETEMVALVENQLSFRLATRLLDMKYNTLTKAIRGSSR
jgi:flagellar basal body rod protein FlgB